MNEKKSLKNISFFLCPVAQALQRFMYMSFCVKSATLQARGKIPQHGREADAKSYIIKWQNYPILELLTFGLLIWDRLISHNSLKQNVSLSKHVKNFNVVKYFIKKIIKTNVQLNNFYMVMAFITITHLKT